MGHSFLDYTIISHVSFCAPTLTIQIYAYPFDGLVPFLPHHGINCSRHPAVMVVTGVLQVFLSLKPLAEGFVVDRSIHWRSML